MKTRINDDTIKALGLTPGDFDGLPCVQAGNGDWIIGDIDVGVDDKGRRTCDGKTKCQNCGEYACEDGRYHCSEKCELEAIAALDEWRSWK
jgi:hypothetical protein